MPSTHTADFQNAALKATDLDAVEKINVGLETAQNRKQLNIIADAPEIRIQDKTASTPSEVNETTMSILLDEGTTHFRAGTETFAEGTETKGDIKFQSSTGATTHAEIVGSSGTLELQDGGLGLKLGSNVSVTGTSKVIQEITGPHARESAVLKKYPEVPLASNVQSGYVASASSQYAGGDYDIWKAHDGETVFGTAPSYYYSSATQAYSTTDGSYTGATWSTTSSGTAYAGEYVQMQFPKPIKLSHVRIVSPDAGATYNKNSPKQGVICGSNDGTTWTTIAAYSGITYATLGASAIIQAPSNVAYKYIRLVATHIEGVGSTGWFVIEELEYYGYEEVGVGDDSVDTTVKSVFNAPDLTNAALYIDGKKSGSDPTDYGGSSVTVTDNGTWDSSDNTWSLSGTTTSNVVSGNLASLVGDHPHSVSVWVKADQLNGSGLFHVGTADGVGATASRVGFVDDSHITWGGEDHFFSNAEWHNVTYTYNGEGSDKKLYLDGRLINTAKNEDTFGEYPPFSMTDYSQFGYSVSASTDAYSTTGFYTWKAFNDTQGNEGWHAGEYDDGSYWYTTYTANAGGAVYDTGNWSRSIAGIDGEWLKLEMPHKLVVDYITLKARTGAETTQSAKDFKIIGSNDDTNWDVLVTHTGVTASTTGKTHVVNATKAYKYLAIVVTRLIRTTASHLVIGELSYHGHKENDLVRFPESVNTLTYPHVAMTGPAQRGYVVTASTNHSGTSFSGKKTTYQGKPFDQDGTTFWHTETNGTNDYRYDGTDYAYGPGSLSNFDPSGINIKGEWIKLQFPTKKKISRVYIRARSGAESQAPEDFSFYGSNTDADGEWTLIQAFTGQSPQDDGTSYYDITSNPAHYKYILLLVTKAVSTTAMSISTLEYIGTEENLDVIARVGDGFDGKVRNVRVYSTALSDARVQEIFDADKDEFGLAKSSVSVYRGHLGVGTTEPKAALTVMDEVAELEEFPPRGFSTVGVSAAALDVKQHIEGHGVFRMSTSSNHGSAGSVPGAFDKQTNTYWHAAGGAYSGTDFSYPSTGTSSLAGIRGDWLRLELPYKVKLSSIGIRARSGFGNQNTYDQSPEDFTILGNNDNGIWTVIQSFTGKSWSDLRSTTIPITTGPEAYNSFAIVITKSANSTGLTIAELRYFGTREQGASTLHNGELSLTRNLTVPRIGPPLDADDTPRRDRLVVEYNTSTNPTENGVVKDTSGRGLDGFMYGAYYDATEKALRFDGTDDYIKTGTIHGPNGAWPHSISLWFRADGETSEMWDYLCQFGTNVSVKSTIVGIRNEIIAFGTYSYARYDSGLSIENNTWYHVVAIYPGGDFFDNSQIYVNGVLYGNSGGYDSQSISFDSSDNFLMLGNRMSLTDSEFGGYLSNFKLYDVALTADEVKRLYDMGRCDEGHHVVNFSKTCVGIGLGDEEAPRAQLDVRGTGMFHTLDVNGIGWIRDNLQVGSLYGAWPYHVKTFTSGTNVQNLSLDFTVNAMYRGGIVKVWLTSGVSGQATVATWSRKVVAFSWKSTSNLAQTTIEDEEANSGNAITISMPSNGILRVQGSMYSSFSYPMMEVEVTYAGGVRAL